MFKKKSHDRNMTLSNKWIKPHLQCVRPLKYEQVLATNWKILVEQTNQFFYKWYREVDAFGFGEYTVSNNACDINPERYSIFYPWNDSFRSDSCYGLMITSHQMHRALRLAPINFKRSTPPPLIYVDEKEV